MTAARMTAARMTAARMTAARMVGSQLDVVVGIVTHRRPASLGALLERLAVLTFPGPRVPRIAVVVVDNSPDLEGRPVVERMRVNGPLHIDYVPLAAGNIAVGRNEVLRAACPRAELVALIDDDELPDPEWLHQLVAAQERTSADVVTGPVLADCPPEAPDWARRRDFYSVTGPASAGWVEEAYTCNVLIRSELVHRLGLQFDEALGVSGGEDQLFFRQARDRGARIHFEPSAVVHEPVAPERLSIGYLLRREYRKGGTLGLLDRSAPGRPPGHPVLRVLRAGWWSATGALAVGRSTLTRDRAGVVAGLLRLARAGGMVHGLLGQTYELYASPAVQGRTRPVVAFVAGEGPGYQRAGHSRHLDGLVSHFGAEGYEVVVVVPGRRTGFLVRAAAAGGVTYCAPALRTVGAWQVMTSPAAIGSHLMWAAFRRLPLVAQRGVDAMRTARRARQQVDHVLGAWLAPGTSVWVTRTLQRIRPDAVLFNTVFMVPDPLVLPSSVQVTAVISHDVVHQRAESFRAAGHRVWPVDFTMAQEAERLAAMDTVVAIHWDDARALAGMAPHAQVVVTPVVVDADPARRSTGVPGRCLFVGSGSLHNVEAVTWFLRNCWPDIVRRQPGAELHVVGTVCARVQGTPEGVVLLGEVDDLTEEYGQASLVIAPLRSGSGLKVKVVEALCHGVATVTTAVGAQGLGGLSPRPYLLADSPEEFADAVGTLLVDGAARDRLESAALSAAPLFSAAQAYAELDERLLEAGVPGARSARAEASRAPVR